jgi:two-component system, sensor histidine kinase and response regulator
MLNSYELAAKLYRIRELGLGRYLVKPIRRDDLFAAVAATDQEWTSRLRPNEDPFHIALESPKPVRILLVNDSTDNRLLVETYLKSGRYLIDEAENGQGD